MADTIVSPSDVFRTKTITTAWNIYRSVADIEAGKPVGSIAGNTLIGKFIRDEQTKKGNYSLMKLALPMKVKVSSGILTSETLSLSQVYIQNQALEKATLKAYKVAVGSTTTGKCNRRTGPGTDYALITPALQEGESAGQSDGTEQSGYLCLWNSDNQVQWVSKSYLTADTGKVTTGTDTIIANVETATSGIDWLLLLKSMAIAALAFGLGAGIAWLVERRHKKHAL